MHTVSYMCGTCINMHMYVQYSTQCNTAHDIFSDYKYFFMHLDHRNTCKIKHNVYYY